GGSRVGTTATTAYTWGGLACGKRYALAVDAYDAAGNRSAKASVKVSTTSCTAPAPTPTPTPTPTADTQAPTVPGVPQKTGSTETSVTVSWSASADNVAVVGYGVYRDGTLVGSSGGTSYVLSGLACGMSYFISVDAY